MIPFYLANLTANQTALAAGLPLEHIYTKEFWAFYIALGGSGATWAVVLMYLRSKSAHLRTIGRLALLPAVFNINEPIIFGSPVVLNPIMFFPFIGAPMINGVIAFFCTKLGLAARAISMAPWTTPAPIGAAWAGGWALSNGLLVLLLVAVDFVIYYPFVKVYERQLLAEEVGSVDAALVGGISAAADD